MLCFLVFEARSEDAQFLDHRDLVPRLPISLRLNDTFKEQPPESSLADIKIALIGRYVPIVRKMVPRLSVPVVMVTAA